MHARAWTVVLLILFAAGCGNGCGTPAASPPPDDSDDAAAPGPAGLTVVVDGLRSGDGTVLVTVFDGPDGFPSVADKAVGRAKAEPSVDTPVSVGFPDLPPGLYAVSAVHDENGDGVLNRNFLGMPTEGYGVSNNPELGYGPPTWEQAHVTLPEGGGQVRVVVRYR